MEYCFLHKNTEVIIYRNKVCVVYDSSNRSLFLDLDVLVKKEGFATKLYDKRRDFSFNVVTFPNLR